MSDSPSSENRFSLFHRALKIFGFVVLLLIAVVIVYVTWISIANWSYIGV